MNEWMDVHKLQDMKVKLADVKLSDHPQLIQRGLQAGQDR